jgi:hypothetical protein
VGGKEEGKGQVRLGKVRSGKVSKTSQVWEGKEETEEGGRQRCLLGKACERKYGTVQYLERW